jgi:eukaryotic-like serine/threonine-protein kinase
MTTFSHQLALPASLADTVGSGMLICPKCRTTYSSTALTTCYRDGQRLVDYERFVAAERDPLRGVLIGGKYKLIERVGQGGMGTIYRAQQTGLNRAVAVKILKRELNVDPDTVARFHREANAMSLLTHPNTVRVYDFGQTDDGLLYLVMELLVGELITDKMERGPLDVLEAVRMTQQILRSLGEAHRKAIVHRDLKPDNVFIARVEGHGEPVVKVLDFGIAKVVAPDRRVDQFETQAGTVFGTPRYMSPEQAQGAMLDGRSDLYSVGALLYQMLIGRAPFTDDDAVVVMAKHIRELPEQPVVATPERPIPQSLNDAVMRALAKDPAERFQLAADFDAALEACVPAILTAQAAAATGRWSHHKPRRVGSIAYGLLAMCLFGVGYFGVRVYAKLKTPESEAFTAVPLSSGEAAAPVTTPADGLIVELEKTKLQLGAATPVTSAPAPTSVRPGARDVARDAAIDVAIRSEPSGASVYRAGKRLGETPLQLRVEPAEDIVRVELRHPGYQPLAAELTAVDGTRLLALTPVHTSKRPRRSAPQRAGSHGSSAASAPGPAAQPAAATKPSGGPYERFE